MHTCEIETRIAHAAEGDPPSSGSSGPGSSRRLAKPPFLAPGDKLPPFDLPALLSFDREGEVQRITHQSFPGRWLTLLYWPLDFSPGGLSPIGKLGEALRDPARDIQVVGVSSHAPDQLLALRASIGRLPFPILSDRDRELAHALRIPHGADALRVTCAVDPAGVVRWVGVEDLSPLRPLREAIRAVDAAGGVVRGAPPLANGHLVSMCAWCTKVRDRDGRWQGLEEYLRERTGEEFTHGICPACFEEQAG